MREGRYKLHIVGNDISYYKPWAMLFALTNSIDDADVVLFTGGDDVSPELYGELNIGYSGNNPARDEREKVAFEKAKALGKPMIGICRGSQFLTVMNGGKLYQHVEGHALGGREHQIETRDGVELPITSTHHQMMRPRGNFQLIGWSNHLGKTFIEREAKVEPEMEVDPEIVFYPDTKTLAIQGHPEYMRSDCDTNIYLRKQVNDLLLNA